MDSRNLIPGVSCALDCERVSLFYSKERKEECNTSEGEAASILVLGAYDPSGLWLGSIHRPEGS